MLSMAAVIPLQVSTSGISYNSGKKRLDENIEVGHNIYQTLQSMFNAHNLPTDVGDEGGFARKASPPLRL